MTLIIAVVSLPVAETALFFVRSPWHKQKNEEAGIAQKESGA